MSQNLSLTHLFEFWIGLASNLVLDVVNVGAGRAREPEAVGAFLHTEDVGARRTEHQHL